MPPPPRLPPSVTASGGNRKAATTSDGCSAIIKILPFGAGQFCNGSTLKGLIFLGGEGAALFMYKNNSDAAVSYQSKLNQIMAERDAERANVDSADQEAYDEETAQKEKQGKDVIARAKQNATYSIASFAGMYALGVIDAFVNEPAPKSKTKKNKKRNNRPRIIHSYNLDLDKAPLGTYALSLQQEVRGSEDLDIIFGYTPTRQPTSDRMLHALALGFSWEL